MNINARRMSVVAGSCAVMSVAIGAAALMQPVPAKATEQYATETGKACGACHQAEAGGGPLNAYGDKFQANGDKVPAAGADAK